MAEARSGPQISSTEELYGVPYLGVIGDEPKECVTWPRYHDGEFSDPALYDPEADHPTTWSNVKI